MSPADRPLNPASAPAVRSADSPLALRSAWRCCQLAVLGATLAALTSSHAQADYIITGGSAAFTLIEGKAAAIDTFNAYFNASATRAQCLADPAPGNAPFSVSGDTVTLADPIRPFGVPVPPGIPGLTRSPQATTLQIENLNDVLGSWTTSNDAFAFVGNSTLGEQIALTSMQRWTGPFSGVLLYGDFGLRYTGSKLVLTSNIDFLNAAWADLGNTSITASGSTLTITGDLLIGGGLTVLDPNAVLGTKFGTVTITATISSTDAVVPEPSSVVLAASGAFGAVLLLRRRPGRKPGS